MKDFGKTTMAPEAAGEGRAPATQPQGGQEPVAPEGGSGKGHRLGRCLKWGVGALVFLALLIGFGQFWAAGYVLEHRLDGILQKVAQKVPGLSLRHQVAKSEFFKREGRIFWKYALKEGNPLGVAELNGAVDYEVEIGFMTIDGHFHSTGREGNLKDTLAALGVSGGDFKGQLSGGLFPPGAELEVEMDPLEYTFPEGACTITGVGAGVSTRTLSSFKVGAGIKSVSCEGKDRYSDRPSFIAALEGLGVTAQPYLEDGSVVPGPVTVTMGKLKGDISTIYAIGFPPEEQVRDATLRDALDAENLSLTVELGDPDSAKRRPISLATSGTYRIAVPSVKGGEEQQGYEVRDLALRFSFDRVDFPSLLKAVGHGAELEGILGTFSDKMRFTLSEASFKHGEDSLSMSGTLSGGVNAQTKRATDLAADFKVSIGAGILKTAEHDYSEDLKSSFDNGSFEFDGRNYTSHIVVAGKQVTLNGRDLKATEAEREDAWAEGEVPDAPEDGQQQ
ncbi:MAG: hypothetical protein K6A65_09530 [Succinivibrionaceae bacterium]|nr:hypothetical protein [Succinivibrionaceae bacterium]